MKTAMIAVFVVLCFFLINSISLAAETEGKYFHDVIGRGQGFEIFKVFLRKELFENPSVKILEPLISWVEIREKEVNETAYFVISFSTLTYKEGRYLHFRVHFDILPTAEKYVFIDMTRARIKMTWRGLKMVADYGESIFFKVRENNSPEYRAPKRGDDKLATTWGRIKQ